MKSPILLLVDDEPQILAAMRRVFRKLPCSLITAGSAAEALDVLHAQTVHLILSDHVMPDMTGIQLLEEARRIDPGIFRVLVSGYVDPEAILAASHDGVVQRFVRKPWSDEDLLSAVEEVLEGREIRSRKEYLEAVVESCKQAEEALRHSNRELSALNAIAEAVMGELELQEVFERALSVIREVFEAEVAAVYLRDPNENCLSLRAQQGMSAEFADAVRVLRDPVYDRIGEGHRVVVSEAPASGAIEHPEVSRAIGARADFNARPGIERADDAREREGILTRVYAPLIRKAEMIGLIVVGYRGSRTVDPSFERLLLAIGGIVGTAAESAQLFDELRGTVEALDRSKREVERTAEEMEALYRLSRKLTHVLDVDELLALTAEAVIAAVGVHAAGLVIAVPGGAHAGLFASDVFEDAGAEALRPAFACAVRAALPALAADLEGAGVRRVHGASPPVAEAEADEWSDRTFPFAIGGREAGLFWIRRLGKEAFREREVHLAETIALHTAATVERLLHALDTERRRVQAMLEGLVEPVVLLDEKGALLCLSGAARRLLALEDPRVRFDPARILPLPLRELFLRGLEHPEAAIEEDIVFERPVPRVYHLSFAPVFSAGRRIGSAALFHDVTARHEVERLKSDFVAHVSHEFRTPLTAIKEAVALLLDGVAGKVTKGQRECLEIASSETDRLVHLVNDVLEISQIEASRLHLNRAPVAIRSLAESVVKSFARTAARANVRISLFAPPRVPRVLADADRVTQILVNLIDNAIRFTPAGGAVTIRIEDSRALVRVRVADTGDGVPESERDRIFENFHSAELSEVTRAGATGLGLSIARGLVEMHGGTIAVVSGPGGGTELNFTLPRMSAAGALEDYLRSRMAHARSEETGLGLLRLTLCPPRGAGASAALVARVERRATELVRGRLYKRGDRIFRPGGDQIAIVLEECDGPSAKSVRERVDRALSKSLAGALRGWRRDWGSAVYPEDGTTPETLLARAGLRPEGRTAG